MLEHPPSITWWKPDSLQAKNYCSAPVARLQKLHPAQVFHHSRIFRRFSERIQVCHPCNTVNWNKQIRKPCRMIPIIFENFIETYRLNWSFHAQNDTHFLYYDKTKKSAKAPLHRNAVPVFDGFSYSFYFWLI